MTADTPRVSHPKIRALIASSVAVAALVTTTAGTAVGAARDTTPPPAPYEQPTFTLSSFNVLGSTHTTPRARKAYMGSGVYRTGLAVRLLDKHGVDVVGFQELQLDQHEEFVRLAGDRYETFPGAMSRRMVQNSIAWSREMWTPIELNTIKIPYFDGIEWDMPYVLLQHNTSGHRAWFANFHNPATNRRHRGNDVHREEAMNRQIALANQLYYDTGLPVFFTGDMNEREDYFCPMVSQSRMKAANGGSFRYGVCTPPPSPVSVDWIFGAKKRGTFSNYVRDRSRLVQRITDHPVIRTDVTLKLTPPPPLEPAPTEPTPEPEPQP